jgi:hypothetical protein
MPHMTPPPSPDKTTAATRESVAAALLAVVLAGAGAGVRADPLPVDKREALGEFAAAYRLAEVWPRMAPKIARDSLPRLEDATHADIEADHLAGASAAQAAHARVASLLAQGRRELEAALLAFDADELAAYTAYSVYARYFETEEIRAITAFFRSATGRKLTTLGPDILAESRHPGAANVMARHFDATELQEIEAFRSSPAGAKMTRTAERIREDMHAHFMERSEATLQAVARHLASQAEKNPAGTDIPAAAPP